MHLNTTMSTEMKAYLEAFATTLVKRMEQGDSKEDADALVTARAKLEREAVTKDLKPKTKRAMEIIGRTFLKEKMEGSKSSGILEIVDHSSSPCLS